MVHSRFREKRRSLSKRGRDSSHTEYLEIEVHKNLIEQLICEFRVIFVFKKADTQDIIEFSSTNVIYDCQINVHKNVASFLVYRVEIRFTQRYINYTAIIFTILHSYISLRRGG